MVVIIIAFVFGVEETFSYFKTKTQDTVRMIQLFFIEIPVYEFIIITTTVISKALTSCREWVDGYRIHCLHHQDVH